MDIYTQALPAHQRAAVEKLEADLVTNVDETTQFAGRLPLLTTRIQ